MEMGTATAPSGGRKQKTLQWAAYAISALCLLWVYHDFDWSKELGRLRDVHWWWIVLAVCCDFLVYVIQSWRWNRLLRPIARVPLWRTVQSIYIGLFANEALPFKSGEVVRCYLLAHWNRLPFSTVLGSGLIERLMDGVILTCGFIYIMRDGEMPRELQLGAAVVVCIVLLLGTLVLFAVCSRRFAHHVTTGHRWSDAVSMVIEGLHVMARSRSFPLAFLGSVCYLGMQFVPVYSLLAGYHLGLGWRAALVVLIVTRLGTIVPGPPSNVGVFHFFAFLALNTMLGVEAQTAKSIAGLMFTVITVPLLACGGIALAHTESDLKEIYDHARAHRWHVAHERRWTAKSNA
jgi:hypothetical protein